jgi:predicted RNA-binding protein with PIN domain
MRFLIDGYNVMYERGLLGQRLGAERFRKARNRFLNEVAEGLGPVDAHQTTVVFDASTPPADLPRLTTHKGLTVVYAVDDENADARLELLIAEHSVPKSLTVVSSDNRVRQAASRRKARVLSADEFLTFLETRAKHPSAPEAPAAEQPNRDRPLTPEEAGYWLEQFGDLDALPETREAFRNDSGIPTEAEIAEIERAVEDEFKSDKPT